MQYEEFDDSQLQLIIVSLRNWRGRHAAIRNWHRVRQLDNIIRHFESAALLRNRAEASAPEEESG